MGVFTYSPEEGTSGFDLAERVPEDVAGARRDRVLAVRDEVLDATQARASGREESLIDELARAESGAGRAACDAPEVDLVTVVRGCDAPVGARVRVRVRALDDERNCLADVAGAPPPSGGGSGRTPREGIFAHWPNRITALRFVGSLVLFAIFSSMDTKPPAPRRPGS
jgi:hypothetical protein